MTVFMHWRYRGPSPQRLYSCGDKAAAGPQPDHKRKNTALILRVIPGVRVNVFMTEIRPLSSAVTEHELKKILTLWL